MVQSWSRWQTEFTLVTNELPSATIGLFPAIISEDKLLLADSDAAAIDLDGPEKNLTLKIFIYMHLNTGNLPLK